MPNKYRVRSRITRRNANKYRVRVAIFLFFSITIQNPPPRCVFPKPPGEKPGLLGRRIKGLICLIGYIYKKLKII
jgi:hypothetical protein